MKLAIATIVVVPMMTSGALAVSKVVRKACDGDCLAYCSQHEIGSTSLRACMRAHRKMLTDTCAKALADSGEATPADVSAYKRDKGLR